MSGETSPAGAAVFIDQERRCPATPCSRSLLAGRHEVLVDDPCWALEGELVAWRKGEERTVRLSPKRRVAGLKLRAEDEQGNALEAEASLDGAPLGAVPGSYRVPICSERLELRRERRPVRPLHLPRTPPDWPTIAAGGGAGESGCSFPSRGFELALWPVASSSTSGASTWASASTARSAPASTRPTACGPACRSAPARCSRHPAGEPTSHLAALRLA